MERREKENPRMMIPSKENEKEENPERVSLLMQLVQLPIPWKILNPPLRMDGMLNGLDQANG